MRRCLFLFLILILTAAASSASADERFVQSREAPVWRTPSFQADKAGTLEHGQAVEVLAEQGGWVHIRCKQKEGWMPKLMLSQTPPPGMSDKSQQAMETLEQRARLRPSAFASTAAARGLMEKQEGFSKRLKLNFKALETMESWRVTDKEAARFLAEGKKHEKSH